MEVTTVFAPATKSIMFSSRSARFIWYQRSGRVYTVNKICDTLVGPIFTTRILQEFQKVFTWIYSEKWSLLALRCCTESKDFSTLIDVSCLGDRSACELFFQCPFLNAFTSYSEENLTRMYLFNFVMQIQSLDVLLVERNLSKFDFSETMGFVGNRECCHVAILRVWSTRTFCETSFVCSALALGAFLSFPQNYQHSVWKLECSHPTENAGRSTCNKRNGRRILWKIVYYLQMVNLFQSQETFSFKPFSCSQISTWKTLEALYPLYPKSLNNSVRTLF